MAGLSKLCPKCGAKNRNFARTCQGCGDRFEKAVSRTDKINAAESKEDKKYSDIFEAIDKNDLQAVKDFLMKDPLLVNADENDGWTPLHRAALHGHKEIAEMLIDKGNDVNAQEMFGNTPLHKAALYGHKEVTEFLISEGADFDLKENFNGETPLHLAAMQSHKDVVEFFISKGADVNAKDYDGHTPLYFAMKFGNQDIIELLKHHGATCNRMKE